MLFACAALTLSDAGSKLLTGDYPLGQIVFVRCAVLLAMLLALAGLTAGGLRTLRPTRWRPQALRAALFILATFLYLGSLSILPLPVVAAVNFLSPLFVAVLAPWLLGEATSPRVWFAVACGLAGVMLVLAVPASIWRWAALLPVAAALAGALRDMSTRRVATQESTLSVVFTTTAAASVVSLLTLPWGWRMPPPLDLALFIAVGVGQGVAYYAQVHAYRVGQAATVTAIKYSTLVWALIFGYWFWGDVPGATTLAGAAIVIASSALLLTSRKTDRTAPLRPPSA